MRVRLFIAGDSEAAIAFQNAKGEIEAITMFIVEDSAFCEWCSGYFDFM